jgi:hypothetical protein
MSHRVAQGFNAANYFMPRNARQSQTRVCARDRGRIGVTDSTCLHSKSEPTPLQAQRLAVPLFEACPVLRLPLLCRCLSFESSPRSVVARARPEGTSHRTARRSSCSTTRRRAPISSRASTCSKGGSERPASRHREARHRRAAGHAPRSHEAVRSSRSVVGRHRRRGVARPAGISAG